MLAVDANRLLSMTRRLDVRSTLDPGNWQALVLTFRGGLG